MSESPPEVPVPEARQALLDFVAVLGSWAERLEAIAAGVPDPRYQENTDAPLNDAAHIQGLIRAILFDDLPTLQRIARTATQSVEEGP